MPIDVNAVKWDEPSKIDSSAVKWDKKSWASTAGEAVKNLPGDIGQLYGEGLSMLGGVANAALHPVETAQKVGNLAEKQLKAFGGEIMLASEKLGFPLKVRPGKEAEAAQFVDAAKNLNLAVSSSSVGQAMQGNFEPLKEEISNRPAHVLLNTAIAAKSLASLAEKAGMTGVASNLSKVESAINPLTMPGRAGQFARNVAKTGSEITTGAPSTVLNKLANLPTLGEVGTNALSKSVGGVTKWGQNIFSPQEVWLRKTYGEDLGQARKMLVTSPEVSEVGARLTPAERTLSLQRMEAPAAEEKLRREVGATPADRANTARKLKLESELKPIAKDASALEEAEAKRLEASKANYAKVDTKTVVSDPELESLLDRGAEAVNKAEKSMRIEGKPFSGSFSKRSDAQKAYLSGDFGMKNPTYSGKTLSEIDRALSDLASMPQGTEGMTATISGKLKGLQSELRSYLSREDKLPELSKALEEHTEHSRNIDRLKVGQFVQNLVTDINKPANETKFLEYWKEAKRGDASRLIKDATGDNTLAQKGLGEKGLGFTPEEINRFDNVAKDLARKRESARQTSLGSGADIGVGEPIKGVPHTLNHTGVIANMLLRLKGEAISKKAANSLAKIVFEGGNEDVLAAFDKAIASGKRPDLNAAYAKLKARQAGELLNKGKKSYTTIQAQGIRNFLGSDKNQNAINDQLSGE